MAKIKVGESTYIVLEDLGYQSSSGMFAKMVLTPEGEKVVVKPFRNCAWRFWTVQDRIGNSFQRDNKAARVI